MPAQSVPVLGEVGMDLVSHYQSERTCAEEPYTNIVLGNLQY